jgi:hypothetical protein
MEETTLSDSSGYLFDQYLLRLNQGIDENWSCNISAVLSRADYQLIERRDDYSNYGIGFNYQVEKNLSFGMDYMMSQRDSNISGDDYDRTQFSLRVTAHM